MRADDQVAFPDDFVGMSPRFYFYRGAEGTGSRRREVDFEKTPPRAERVWVVPATPNLHRKLSQARYQLREVERFATNPGSPGDLVVGLYTKR
jgi:hypothetical protein